ncbi:S15/NS1 RNA-binding domain-containing protein [Pluteus cervinus]|uniref:S15/NS1 RNA-binding domain-containing protein n=1 Tax=Pluteus cervinus TaxID=181527 RepID=A0ACD3ATI6_9AGAR|nr:S15/NS1 RNA-binding domain-containing protein [Pluteus cervinus]
MLAALRAQSSRPLCSLTFQSTSAFHTSTPTYAETSRKHLARAIKKANNLKKEERWRAAQANRPSVILGTRPGDESKWTNCDLAKVLVDEKELISSTELEPTTLPVGTVYLPKQLGYGVGEPEKELLFRDLPILSAQAPVMASQNADPNVLAQEHQNGLSRELSKANAFAKVLDLRNASAGGIAYENRRRIVAEFSSPDNPFDPGRSEVQAAILTYRIRNLWSHLTQFKRDVGNRRGLRKLVHQRAKVLKYLKKSDRVRYDTVLERLALEPESVEGELVV